MGSMALPYAIESNVRMRSSASSMASAGLPQRSTLALASTVPAPSTRPSSDRRGYSKRGRVYTCSAQVKNEPRTSSASASLGDPAAAHAGLGAAVFVQHLAQFFHHHPAQLL